MTSSGLIGKMGYPSYTPALSSACSPWQVSAHTPHLSAWPSPFPQSLSRLPSESPTQPRELPASCTAQEYFGIWSVSCDASMGHFGVLVKYLLAMNSPQIPASSGIPEEEVCRKSPSPSTTLKCLALLLVPKSRARIKHVAGKSMYVPGPHPAISVLTHSHREPWRSGDPPAAQL